MTPGRPPQSSRPTLRSRHNSPTPLPTACISPMASETRDARTAGTPPDGERRECAAIGAGPHPDLPPTGRAGISDEPSPPHARSTGDTGLVGLSQVSRVDPTRCEAAWALEHGVAPGCRCRRPGSNQLPGKPPSRRCRRCPRRIFTKVFRVGRLTYAQAGGCSFEAVRRHGSAAVENGGSEPATTDSVMPQGGHR
jgi:hypothetical protein